ncbi:hypothetical protein MAA_11499 [Metarhizium robertsii ARSEF 23]|uniref:Uncharacterized protein n=1 Tax=Metarhizium robertsii (strain ARSEF 23 / ATCC MYA-3075) TaxID=655844 RepID=A0A0B2XHC7_METRA|nr:uncharacterized protein MAA_11499 [Metarhizium robertsii ARSEF 23]KHO10962.1 hypothetical protein MAA_11499 [Metarhizium robertsii ARSEF 23]
MANALEGGLSWISVHVLVSKEYHASFWRGPIGAPPAVQPLAQPAQMERVEDSNHFPDDCLPPEDEYSSREALYAAINAWAAPEAMHS